MASGYKFSDVMLAYASRIPLKAFHTLIMEEEAKKNPSEVAMDQAGGTRMDTKLIAVGSKWLVTRDCEHHKAGEALEVAEVRISMLGSFVTCEGSCQHGLDVFLQREGYAHAVPMRDEAFWARYAPAEAFAYSANPPNLPGQVCVWGADDNWSVWLGTVGNGAILLAKGGSSRNAGTGRSVGDTAFGLSTGRWRIIQDVGQAEPTPLDKVGYKLANPMLAGAAAMGVAAGRSVSEIVRKALDAGIPKVGGNMHDAVHPTVPRTNCRACLLHPAAVGAKATLCEACITKRQLEADFDKRAASDAWRWKPRAPGHGAQPSSHAIAAGGIFDLHVPKPRKAWKYPEVDEFDLLPDA